ncbi:MAG TPA: carboxypeptidase-like regulatory domain-containing protein, partial [Ferruginibacter sp.]|nr:carboxypeptidase-like regulatory domain-containing protein [Ferruginibacter sp.]
MKSSPFLLFLFIAASAFGQSHYSITGKVISEETKLPLQGASVFAQNTTIGTATDVDGVFHLLLPYGGYNLVVTFTGYSIESHRITATDAGENLLFEMKQREKEMEEVSVVSTNEVRNGWEKYGNFFMEQFIGRTINSAGCQVKNIEALKFYFSKKRNRLKVIANEPLQIVNNSLGYNIAYSLDSFTHDYSTQVSLYTGYPLFEEILPESTAQEERWKQARRQAYKGSILHFMRSIYNRNLKEQGFEVQYLVRVNENEKAITLRNFYAALNYKKDDSTLMVDVHPNQQALGVIYTKEKPAGKYVELNPGDPRSFQFSILTFAPQQTITIEQNGYYFDQDDIAISEYWTWDKVADLLPY